ncbi:ubiquitin carboxyl-terminal hydrolase 8-like [Lytechinus pictus]|uniref:ubiquitin carboxyl-terminal hydrolase 8-like n=1 Tax=Lytechinus pictus TaxID=7653 RepID=UPI0030B9EB14
MPGALKKPLYISSSIEELNKKVDQNITKGQTSKILARSANKVFVEAEKADKNLDEERAYVLFMKYLTLWKAVQKAKDYKSNKDYIDTLIGKAGCRKAIDKAEELSASLTLRYNELEEAKEASKKLEEEKEKVKTNGLKDGKSKDGEEGSVENGVPEEEKKREFGKDGVVTAIELYHELVSNTNSVLIMDVRRSDHFKDSHMTIGECMSIPAEILKPGTTAATLEKGLGEEAKAMWRKRTDMESIVLVDWDQCQNTDSTLAIVQTAMVKWDWSTTYKNPSLVLKGGYEDWLFKYPMYTNNPHAKKPIEKGEETKDLLDFDYPVFEDEKPLPMALPPQQLNNAPTSQAPSVQNGNDNGIHQDRMFFISGKPGQTSQPGQRPVVDRSVKPGATKPDPPAPSRDQIDLSRDKPISTPTPVANQINNNLENKTVPPTSNLANSEPAVSTAKPAPAMPAVNRNLKPKVDNKVANINVKELSDSTAQSSNASVNININKPRTEPRDDSTMSMKDPSVEASMKSDVHLEELKKKEEQARNDLNKMRYDKTKAENEKLKEEKLEMEKNLLKLQQELAEAKARQEQRKRTPQKTSSPSHTAQSPSPVAGSQDAPDSASSSSNATTKTVNSTPSPSKETSDSKSKEPAADRNAVQPNQNSNAATAKKSASGASLGEASTSSSTSSSASSPPVTKAAATAPALPKGWEKRFDEKSKRYFYIDHNTNTTQWHPPGEPSPKPVATEAKGSIHGPTTAVATSKPKGESPSSRPSGQVTRKPLKSDSVEPSAKSGGLKRSFSSPNIAQMVMNEGEASVSKPFPSVDRNTKPVERPPQVISQTTHSRVRHLNPVHGSQGRALTGLRNLGNTCFMNSVIQCLSNTTPLAKYFIKETYLRDINRANPLGRGGEVAEEFAVVVTALWSGLYRSIAPRDLRDTVTKYVPEFRKHVGHHHDSQEFLLFLMDGLHEDLNEVKKREYIKEEDFSKYADDQAATLSWRNHDKLNRSIIVSLFQGQFKSTVQCLSCNNISVKFEAFMYLSLPIPSNSRCTLNDCLQRFSQPEKLAGDNATHCTRCKGKRNSKKTILIWKLPNILLIHLKRFYYEGMWRQKLQTNVDFPNELTVDRYVIGPKRKDTYQLYGVSNHSGTLDGGHYTACCRNAANKRWYKYDDHEVYDASQSSIKSSAAYILFYSSIPLSPP